MATFINRHEETAYLTNHFKSEPNNLLFVCGPKSSGKSSLLNKVAEKYLDNESYSIYFMDLRGILIYDFDTFLNRFFLKVGENIVNRAVKNVSINLPFVKVDLDEESLFKKNPFEVFENYLNKKVLSGVKPIIIIDEIQLLKNIYVNNERYLLDELFNLFVRLTKVKHIAHIVLATSDSYFIEEIYNNAKLKKATKLYFVDHLRKVDVEKWLLQEKFLREEIEIVWDKLGGSAWEITELINGKNLQNITVNELCEYFVKDNYNKLMEFDRVSISDEQRDMFYEINMKIKEKGYCLIKEINNKKMMNELIVLMVNYDFWFFKADEQKIVANSRSIEMSMRLL